ncbi:MAG: BPSS1780 family membrane protein [Methylotenera sp.]|nr:BPSS1780 family membrane protein [Methylotenera sp.]MDP1755097.1 BPSS1780 family membrane protein [Methylotenera sp.]MDP1958470.1 BPSS1780 family membrane protein [Methylotenera sp.]MDP3207113.1 BPSS1780 family membrane protein [Methylotenera sp.]MDP3303813.1 BPSS1780 family membrane protein [Methylotenera sp.]
MAENPQNQALTLKQVPVANAWAWIVSGFYLFKANPAMWIILLVIYLAIMIPLSLLPGVGSVVSTLLAPVFAAGMMWGCQALTRNQDLEINHLFEGFKKNTAQLIAVGGIYMVGLLVVAVLVVLALDKQTIELLVQGKDLSSEQADAMLLPILIAMLFIMPILMAYWFAPILAGLHGLGAVDAMKLSFVACLTNMLPFLLYGLIFMVLLIIAIIPFGLGLVLVVPLMMTSLYTSYVDIFSIENSNNSN